jgi:hypothetical protein
VFMIPVAKLLPNALMAISSCITQNIALIVVIKQWRSILIGRMIASRVAVYALGMLMDVRLPIQ